MFRLFDPRQSGRISRTDFLQKTKDGVKLPDFGLGPGHHGDDEYEYEIHHFEKYHDENTREEDLIHPEEIGVQLTEGMMMDPEASVSALVFHHPDCVYFTAADSGTLAENTEVLADAR